MSHDYYSVMSYASKMITCILMKNMRLEEDVHSPKGVIEHGLVVMLSIAKQSKSMPDQLVVSFTKDNPTGGNIFFIKSLEYAWR